MKKQFIKIICFTVAILIILITPLCSYFNSNYNYVYGFDDVLTNKFSLYLAPIVGYLAYNHMNQQDYYSGVTDAAAEIATIISDIRNNATLYINAMSNEAKVRILKLYTELSNYEINELIKSTFSNETMERFDTEVASLQTKINSNLVLTEKDLYSLGIYNPVVKQLQRMSSEEKTSIGSSTLFIDNGVTYRKKGDVLFLPVPINKQFFKTLGGTASITATSLIGNGAYYLLKYYLSISHQGNIIDIILDSDYTTAGLTVINGFPTPYHYIKENVTDPWKIYLTVKYNNTIIKKWDTDTASAKEKLLDIILNPQGLEEFLDVLDPLVAADLTESDYYINSSSYSVWDLLGLSNYGTTTIYSPDVVVGQSQVIGLTSGVLTNESDVSQTAAEQVIANQDANTIYDNNVDVAYDETGTTIILTPGDIDIPDIEISDYPDTNIENPETGGILGDGVFKIPILGDILKWIIKLWELLKQLVETIINWFTANPTVESGDSGTDWGNFKGFFDIFFIFYYLIIIAILLLLKFLAVVMNILNISPNTALFDSYPTILQGINYVKGLKVGGFNITIQQIFEYMFMVFFFIYIVTTLQKLYHSFTGVERQELRHNQRDIQIEKTTFSNETPLNNFNTMNIFSDEQNKKSDYELRETTDLNLYNNQKEGDKIRYYYANKSASEEHLKNGGNKK